MHQKSARIVAGVSLAALAATLVGTAAQATVTVDTAGTPVASPTDVGAPTACAAVETVYLSDTNTTSALHQWTLSDGSATAFTPDGLDIVSTSKVGYMNYEIERFDVADAGEPAFDYVRVGEDDEFDISLNLAYSEDSSGSWAGTLVYEPGVYGVGNWWSTKDNKNGNWHLFTLEELVEDLPEAMVLGVGFSLGSTQEGTGTVKSLTAGCAEYRFLDTASVPHGPALPTSVVDFEDAAHAAGADGGLSGVAIAGADKTMPAAAGCYYAEAPVVQYNTSVFTRYAGYSSVFPEGGYTASADFYLDATAPAGQFDWSHAINGTDGSGKRDFIFHAGADGAGTWTVGVSNNAANSSPYLSGFGAAPVTVTDSGWYTFQHTVRAQDNLAYVDLAVLDAHGDEVAAWTLGGNAADIVPTVIGGNRYGWLVNNSYENLPIDNVLLNAERPTDACPAADFTELNAALAKADALDEGLYTAESFAAVTTAVEAAAAVEGANKLEQDEVDAATAAIEDAIAALEFGPADVADLEQALAEAEAVVRTDRTPESLELLDAAIVLGKGVLGSTADAQVEVDAAVAVLKAAIEALDYLPANVDVLKAAIASADAVNRSQRTPGSLANLDAAVAAGEALLNANVTQQDQVAAATKDVLDAIDDLVYRSADTAALKSALAAIKGVNLSNYTVPSVAKVNTALKGANVLVNADIRSQGEVNAKAKELRIAYQGLVRIPKFSDIATSQFRTHIEWFAAQGITTGYADGTYRPLGTVNRDAMAAFLYRWAGSPAYTAPSKSPFADVPTSQPYYKEIAWLASEGISTGWAVGSKKEYRPYEPIDRNAMAAFLYRFADVKGYTAPSKSPFVDVKVGQQFYKEMAWLAETGVSTGWTVPGGKEFRPSESITRDAMAAFLYRMDRF
ncbi:S-layer homology domain-containing protein [Demequina sp. NBRC 110056]|uniref:S-layer homology domain-containing protein n=1 Tax=Demequina sp. NBRC 110056 TaxID=1570345 RepID=UPI00135630EA|nr:S-layer homology domain-containing protein [Demequina sp. NBRC 110056]